jgi:GDP-4-dehydro-6-deoxy-D-mannose reductase
VTGGAGFIGSAVCRRAATAGKSAVALVRDSDVSLLASGTAHRVVDWADPADVVRAVQETGPRAIIHCAGASARGGESAAVLYDANVGLTARLLEAVADACPDARVVLLSSASVYGSRAATPIPESAALNPESHYATSKVMTEMLGHAFSRVSGLRIAIARPFNVIGLGEPPGSVVSRIAEQVLAGAEGQTVCVRLREVASVRDYVDVDDVADALLVLADRGQNGETYNVCSGVGTSVGDLVREAARVWRREVETVVAQPSARGTVSVGSFGRLHGLGWTPHVTLTDTLSRMRSQGPRHRA